MTRPRARGNTPPAALALLLGATLAGCVTVPRELRLEPADGALAKKVARLAAKTPARLGIAAHHIESGRRLVLNERESFEAASTIKIALLAEAFARVHEGTFDLTDRWKLPATAVAAGSGILDEFEPGLSPTNRDLLRIMISLSDNTATNSFIDRLGTGAVNARMEALGLPGIRLLGRVPDAKNEPDRWVPLGSITPHDAAAYFGRLFSTGLLDPASDRAMREIFRAQRTTSRIPRLLLRGKKNVWAGKTGSMHAVRNDAGVLTTRKGRFVLVVLADRIPDDERDGPAVTRAMGEIAKTIVEGWSATLPDVELPPDPKPPPRLLPAVARLEMSPRQILGWPGAPGLERILRDADRRFWTLWEKAGGSLDDACLVPAPNSWWDGNDSFKVEPVSAIVLHHTSMATDEECLRHFAKAESLVSAHFLVGRDGGLWQFVSLEHRAWHAGPSLLHGRTALNRTSVGVEITGDGALYPFTPAAIETVVRLVGVLVAQFHIQAPWIAGHQHVAPDRKDDPGRFFPWNDVVRRGLELAERLRAETGVTVP